VISLTAVGSAASAGEYYAKDNYYLASELADGSEWIGDGASKLGLEGRVDAAAFTEVLAGRLPDGSILDAARGEHRPGLDLTFSAPKSLSLLALVGRDDRIVAAFRESVQATLAWAETNLIEARVWDPQAKRQIVEKTGNMVAAGFLHDVSRNGDPQLHVHAVIANATLASDGKWHAVRNDVLYQSQHLLGAIHNAELRSRVEALGYETVPARNPINGEFEIKGVSRDAVEAFSTRRAEILEALAKEDRGSPREREIAALATRRSKNPEFTPAERGATWQATAARVGFNPKPLIRAAINRTAGHETVWSKVVRGVRGAGAKGMAIAAAMGLTPRDSDPLVPERLGHLDPGTFATAQAVASAVRELGEREAAFDRNDIVRTALERGGPVTVKDVEARIGLLREKGLLLSDARGRMMATEGALALEQKLIAVANLGRGVVSPLIDRPDVSASLQAAARDLGLRRLNPGQEAAGVAILQSRNRVELIQGGAGVGKSASLAPVAHLVKAEGRQVFALAHAGRTARDFGQKIGAPASTVDSFLARHQRILDGTASPQQVDRARASLGGAVIMVDEASQLGTERLAKLIDLANRMDVGRLVLAGDTRQLQAIEAGKPFELLQTAGQPTSTIAENLRATSPQMQALNAALEQHDLPRAFDILRPETIEVPFASGPAMAARLWVERPPEEREKTLLLASGRAMRSAANTTVQEARLVRGELTGKGQSLTVLDRVTITREGARQMKGYREGRVVAFRTNLPSQGIRQGDRGVVQGMDKGQVVLSMTDGSRRRFEPDRLPRNLAHDAVTIYEPKQLPLFAGDRIRWTDNDRERGLLNGDMATIERAERDAITVRTQGGERLQLGPNDPMREKLDLAYAVNVHIAQGMTATNGIILMSEREKLLNTSRSFLVAVTRIAERAVLVVDNVKGLERDIMRREGEKTSAIETVEQPSQDRPNVPERERVRERVPEREISLEMDMDMGM
jgi:conjugative relaxase-like TrwC/TraI family protein